MIFALSRPHSKIKQIQMEGFMKAIVLASFVLLVSILLAACAPAAAPTAPPVPPTATPTAAAPSGFVENDGVRIHYEVEGQGPPVVLLHGWTGSIEDWRLFGAVDGLKDAYRLILIDARGHGQSDKPHDQTAYVLEKQVGDINAVLDELGIDKAHFFGYSMGGRLGWALAKYAPDRVASLIIVGNAPESWDASGTITFLRENGIEGLARMVEDTARKKGVWKPEIYPLYAANDVEAVLADLSAFSAESFTADLPKMNLPILLLAGTAEEDYPGLAAAARKLPAATFVALPGFDHADDLFGTDQVLAQVTKFLAQVGK